MDDKVVLFFLQIIYILLNDWPGLTDNRNYLHHPERERKKRVNLVPNTPSLFIRGLTIKEFVRLHCHINTSSSWFSPSSSRVASVPE